MHRAQCGLSDYTARTQWQQTGKRKVRLKLDDSRFYCRRSASEGQRQTSYQYRDSHTLEAAHPCNLLSRNGCAFPDF